MIGYRQGLPDRKLLFICSWVTFAGIWIVPSVFCMFAVQNSLTYVYGNPNYYSGYLPVQHRGGKVV